MQTARHYMTDASNHMEHALNRMPLSMNRDRVARALPVTTQEINRYVEQLLTPEEQNICDHATD